MRDSDEASGEHEALLQFLYLCPHGMAQFDRHGTIIMLNPAFACLAMPLVAPGAPLVNVVDLMAPLLPELRNLLQDPRRSGMICDGTRVHLGAPAPGEDPRVLALTIVRMDPDRHMAVISDVTRQAAYERRLIESEAWFAAVVQGADDYAVLGLDADGRVSGWNMSGERMFGYEARAALGRSAGAMVGADAVDAATFSKRLREAGRDGWHLDEGWRTRADGSRFWGTCIVSPVELDPDLENTPTCYLMVVRDVTARQQSAQELRRALTADHLTGVLNRRCFLERATREMARQAEKGAASCVAMLDVDHFKTVNDRYGHAAGDAVLAGIAEVVRNTVRDADLIGRLGGEEFAIFMPASDAGDAMQAAEALRAGVAALRLTHEGQVLEVTVSIGLSVDGGADLKRLMAEADAALYVAKRSGRNRISRAAPAECA